MVNDNSNPLLPTGIVIGGSYVCESKIVIDTFELVAQVNGKIRATMNAPADISKEQAIEMATSHDNVIRYTEGKTIRKTIYVPGKLVNIVVL